MKRFLLLFPAVKLLPVWAILTALTTAIAHASCTPPPSGIVAWWPAEGSTVDVIGGNNGTLSSTGAGYATGEVGQGFRFDGTNGIMQVPDSAALKPTNVTLEAWVWLDPNTHAVNFGPESIIFKKNTWSYDFEGYSLLKTTVNNGGTYSDHFQTVVSSGGTQIIINSITVAQRGVWYHVAATYDGNTLSLYVNGVREASAVAGFALDYGTKPICIGATGEAPPYTSYFAGIIDEASIYNRSLASNEIAAIYLAGSAGKCSSASVVSGIPAISNVFPASGSYGTTVTIFGTNFSSSASSDIVYFGAVQANVSSATPTSLTVTVPSGATYAPVTVTVGGLTAAANTPFLPTFAGNGSGISLSSFAPRLDLPTLSGPGQTVIADLDGDGKPDLIVADVYNNSVSIYRNISAGGTLTSNSFATRIDLPATSGNYSPATITVADIDGDGKLDIIASESGDNLVSVYRNTSTPGNLTTNSFTNRVDFATGVQPQGVVVRDLDGDGRPDIIVANLVDGTISILRNTGSIGILTSNSFAPRLDIPTGAGCDRVAVGDLNGDGKPDIAAANNSVGTVSILQNVITSPGSITTASFAPKIDLNVLSGAIQVSIVDVDGDGKPDLAVTAYLPQTFSLIQNLSNGGNLTSNSFAPRIDFPLNGRGHTIAVGDIDGDGKPDLIVDTELNSLLNVFRNVSTPGTLTSSSLATQVELAAGWNAWGASVGDLDGDGRPDIISANSYDGTLSIYQNVTPFASGPANTNPPAISAVSPNTGTNGTTITIFGTNFSATASANIVYFGAVRANVSIATPTSLTVTVPVGATYAPVTVTVGGLTAWAAQPFMPTFNGGPNSTLTLAPRLDLPAGNAPGQAIFADVDGDGKPDLLVTSSQNFISIYPNISSNGMVTASSFGPRVDVPMPGNIQNTVMADVDGDGRLDIVVLDRDAGKVHILKNLATPGNITSNSFAASVDLSTGNDPRGLVVRDLDGDGLPDIAVANWADSTVGVYRNLGTAAGITTNSFAAPVICSVGAQAQDLKAGDLDGDGKPDLITANNNYGTTNSVSLLRNLSTPGNISFAPQVALTGLPTCYCLAIGDLDGDGKLDIAVSSFDQGQSVSVYRNLSSPGSLTVNSFAADVDFSTGGWGNGVAIADLDGDGKPDLAVVTQLPDHLSIFKNISSPGSFTSNSLAPRADYSTGWNPNGVAIDDIDGDGRPDIAFAVSYASTVSIYQNTTVPFAPAPPVITAQTPSQFVLLGSPATFSVTASGSNPLFYFWSRNGSLISGATNSSYTLLNAQLADSGSHFSCLVTNAYGFANGTNDNLKVIDTISNDLCSGAVVITSFNYTNNQSTLMASSYGDPVPDCIDGFGNGVWYQFTAPANGLLNVDTSGSDFDTGLAIYTGGCGAFTEVACNDDANGVTSALSIPATAGTTYYFLAGGYGGHAGNLVFHLNYYQPPVFTTQPTNLTVIVNSNASFTTALSGSQPISLQWYFNNTPLADGSHLNGSQTSVLNILNVQTNDGGNYQLIASNIAGIATSSIAVLTPVYLPPTATLVPPVPANVYQGGKLTFGSVVHGAGALTYQWFFSPTNKNYVPVPNATNTTLVLDPAIAVQTGNYYIAVSNQIGGVTSAPVGVKVFFARVWGFSALTNIPVNLTNTIALATGGNALGSTTSDYFALGSNGKLTSWASAPPLYGETNVAALSNSIVTAIAAGYQTSLALKSDGTVYAWGNGSFGQTNPPAGLNGVVAISCGGYHDLALKADGTIVGWGDTLQAPVYGQATNNPAATNVVAIAAGNTHSLVLRADGSVVAWGYGLDNSTTVPAGTTNIIAIAAGSGLSLALRNNGTVVQWGSALNTFQIPSGLSNVVAISASGTHCTALKNNGTVVTWGGQYSGISSNYLPADLTNVVGLASGGDHDMALFGTRAPVFTVQPWNRTVTVSKTQVNTITLAGKVSGVQPMSYHWLVNGTNLPTIPNNPTPVTTNDTLVLRFDANTPAYPIGAYQLVASNSYGVTVSKPAKVTVLIPLGDAVDAPNLAWLTSGAEPWFGENSITHDGIDAVRSGDIGGSQETILQTTLTTNFAGNATFWWKVSSEQFFDTLEFRVNGTVQATISGEVDWQQASIPLAPGTNVLMWRYSKDASFDGGLDAGFVDQFAFVPGPPFISNQPAGVVANLGANVSLSVAAVGVPQMNYQWWKDGNAVGGNSPVLAMSNVSRANEGNYCVTVTNAAGSTTSSTAVVRVRVPQMLGSPQLLPDGSLQLISTDSTGSVLTDLDLPNFEAQASSDLVNWTTLPNALTLTNGMLQLSDTSSTNSTRFYRIIEH